MRSFLHGAVQLHVLHHAAEHPIHGAWMAAELGRHGYRISPGTLYPTLHRLEAAGLLAGQDDLEAGRRVRRYTITDAGRRRTPAVTIGLKDPGPGVPRAWDYRGCRPHAGVQ